MFGHSAVKIAFRQTVVHEISSREASEFLDQNHLQPTGRASKRLGLFSGDELVAVMTFSKSNKTRSQQAWEIVRFAVRQHHSVAGAASKMFSHFVSHNDVRHVTSFSDNRWQTGEIYQRLGFELVHAGTPNCWYFKANDTKLYPGYSLRKNKHDVHELTEWQNRVNQGWNRIWDCGHTKWVWHKEKPRN